MGLDFHLHEYDALRAEILDKMHRIEQGMRFAIVADAAVMAWILTAIRLNRNITFIFASWLPLVVTLTFFVYALRNRTSIARLGSYISLLEERYADNGMGWEHRKTLLPRVFKGRKRWTSGPAFVFTIIVTFFFGLICTSYIVWPDMKVFGIDTLVLHLDWPR